MEAGFSGDKESNLCHKGDPIYPPDCGDENNDNPKVGNIDEHLEEDPARQSKDLDDNSGRLGGDEDATTERISNIAHKTANWLDLTDETEGQLIIASKAIAEDMLSTRNKTPAGSDSTCRDAPTANHQLVALKSEISNNEELRPEDAIDEKMLLGAATPSCLEGEKESPLTEIAEQVSSEVEGQTKKQDEDEKALHGQTDSKSGDPETKGTPHSAVAPELNREEEKPMWYDSFPGMLSVHDPSNLIRQTVWQNQDIPPSDGPASFLRTAPPPSFFAMVLNIEGSLGVGNHGAVLRGVLTTRECMEGDTDTMAIPVAVKVSTHSSQDRQHFQKEM